VTKKKIGPIALALVMVAAIVSLRNFPFCAQYGLSSIFYLGLASLTFFIPTAQITLELSTTFPGTGGTYHWVKQAYGSETAFLTLWLGWLGTITWFPAILIFSAAMAYAVIEPIIPGLHFSTYFAFFFIIIFFWGTTLINLRGMNVSAVYGGICVVVGTILPGILIICLGIFWMAFSQKTQIDFGIRSLIPALDIDNIAIFSAVLLSFSGAELVSFHVNDTENPEKTYRKSLFLATILIMLIYVLGTLSVIVIVPNGEINLSSGVLQSFMHFFAELNMNWAVPMIAFALLLGSLAGINSWIVGPAKGMLAVADDSLLPNMFRKVNGKDVPYILLMLQAIVGTILSLFVFLLAENNDEFLWVLTALAFQFLSIQYIIIFLAAMKLRRKFPEILRPYRVRFIGFKCIIAIVACAITFIITFLPPKSFTTLSFGVYSSSLLAAMIIFVLPVVFLIKNKRRLLLS